MIRPPHKIPAPTSTEHVIRCRVDDVATDSVYSQENPNITYFISVSQMTIVTAAYGNKMDRTSLATVEGNVRLTAA